MGGFCDQNFKVSLDIPDELTVLREFFVVSL